MHIGFHDVPLIFWSHENEKQRLISATWACGFVKRLCSLHVCCKLSYGFSLASHLFLIIEETVSVRLTPEPAVFATHIRLHAYMEQNLYPAIIVVLRHYCTCFCAALLLLLCVCKGSFHTYMSFFNLIGGE